MKRLIALLLLLALLPLSGLAFQKGFGEFAMDHVNVREKPGGRILFKKQRGEEVYLLSHKEQGGHTWYQVSTYDAQRVKPRTVWVRADMVIPPEELFQNIAQVSAYESHLIALRKDGTAQYGGESHKYLSSMRGDNPATWQDVTQVASTLLSVFGLKKDGSIYRWGIRGPVSGVKGIPSDTGVIPFTAMDAHADHFLGVMADGSLDFFSGAQIIPALPTGTYPRHIDVSWGEPFHALVVTKEGTVRAISYTGDDDSLLSLQQTLDAWQNIKQVNTIFRSVAIGKDWRKHSPPIISALTMDGTVLTLDPTLEKETRGWLNVAKLTGGDGFLAGLTTDGRVLLAGNRQKVADAAQWTDIVDIACGYDFCTGVTKDGRLLFAGDVHFDHH